MSHLPASREDCNLHLSRKLAGGRGEEVECPESLQIWSVKMLEGRSRGLRTLYELNVGRRPQSAVCELSVNEPS